MGRAAAFTHDEIFQAADQIKAGGQSVTANAIRDVLGRGSYSTIVKALREWEQSQAPSPSLLAIEMPDAAKTAFAQCWNALNIEASKIINQAREEIAATVNPLRLQYEDALMAIAKMETEQVADASRIADLEFALTSARQSESESHTQKMVLTAVIDQMQQRVDAQQAEINRLRPALAIAQQDALDKSVLLARAEGELSALKK
jgi:hypothetical protein